MFDKQTTWSTSEFPLVQPSEDHIVLYEITNGKYIPKVGKDKWDHDHVKMPCSDHNMCTYEDGDQGTQNQWDIIVKALSQKMQNSQELADAILTHQSHFKEIWKFKALHRFFNEYWEEAESKIFFEKTLTKVAQLAILLPELVKSPIPFLKQGRNKSISFTQLQLASLLANAFFCTFPERNKKRKDSEYRTFPPINFNLLYDGGGPKVMEKFKFICHYFTRVCAENPIGVVTFSRRHVPIEECPDWANISIPISTIPVTVGADKVIEDAHGWIQMDFANKYIGGGVLRRGGVQEEIRFVSNPELIASLLFTEVMGPTETVMIIGTERYSTHTGYSATLKWSQDYKDDCPSDSSARRQSIILALDARRFPQPELQYCKEMVDRELNKAYVGFSFYATEGMNSGVATGNWGCGAFGGSAKLKTLLQTMACGVARRPMAYFTFGDPKLCNEIQKMIDFLTKYNVTIGELYECLIQFCESDDPVSIFTDLYKNIEDLIIKRSSTQNYYHDELLSSY